MFCFPRFIILYFFTFCCQAQFAFGIDQNFRSIAVKTILTVIHTDGTRSLDKDFGTLTLVNTKGIPNSQIVNNSFVLEGRDLSFRTLELSLPKFVQQDKLLDVLTTGLRLDLPNGYSQMGKVLVLNLVLRLRPVDTSEHPGMVGIVNLSTQIKTNLIEALIEESSFTVTVTGLSSPSVGYSVVPFESSELPSIIEWNREFADFRQASEVIHYLVSRTLGIKSPLLPIGRNFTGDILFVDQHELSFAIQHGGEVRIFSDPEKFLQASSFSHYQKINLEVKGLSSQINAFREVASLYMQAAGWDMSGTPAKRREFLWRAVQILKIQAIHSQIMPESLSGELLSLQCSRVFWR